MAIGRMSSSVRRARQAGCSARRLDPPAPGRRVVGEDLERVGADLVRPVDGLDHPGPEGQVRAEASSVGKHPRHRTPRNGRARGRSRRPLDEASAATR